MLTAARVAKSPLSIEALNERRLIMIEAIANVLKNTATAEIAQLKQSSFTWIGDRANPVRLPRLTRDENILRHPYGLQ